MQINNATLFFAGALRQVGKRIRLRGWERMLRALFHPDKQRHVAFRIPFNGFTYPAYADNIVDWNALFYGTYETFELKLLAAIADSIKGAVFVDAGANVGHHALYMAAHARRVHAFEPNPALWPLIEEKISINSLDNLTLHRCGLGSKACQLPLYLGPESGEASLFAGASRTSLSTSIPATIVQGDDYFRQAGIDRLELIKMDIEGFEKHAIEGMSACLDTWRPVMMIEISEIGKEEFGNFTSFVQAFPEGYAFYFCQLGSSIIIRTALEPANETAYVDFVGNVFCIPKERECLFKELVGDTATVGMP